MIYIGCHLSVTNGYAAMGRTMSEFGGKLGQGSIGMEAMKRIALHPALDRLPFILETPNEDEGYIDEIHTVLRWQEGK